ncbi:hypothetical protein FISHEDRAFT_59374 [Fistulina hepatica ATCC 64428]|uniref:HTH cro/C1-type domain-containing protein n=1 Tax=Fistulina hepatica ATCC 64428 TaxID=1128425 RepID=A0A0D7ABG0_9AGAR|nr:hypothetical protein FISHEDRAFT_59374 [Fistulina hepatica ATCC 64428]
MFALLYVVVIGRVFRESSEIVMVVVAVLAYLLSVRVLPGIRSGNMVAAAPVCPALAAAMYKTGTTFSQIAVKIREDEQHVIDVCTGKCRPTAAEFTALASALNITSPLPHNHVHQTA